jgi:hypothetical protein
MQQIWPKKFNGPHANCMHVLATHLFGHHEKQTEDVFIIFDPHLIINKCKQQESFRPQEFITLITTIIVLIDSQE